MLYDFNAGLSMDKVQLSVSVTVLTNSENLVGQAVVLFRMASLLSKIKNAHTRRCMGV